jgi:hypothetical protein
MNTLNSLQLSILWGFLASSFFVLLIACQGGEISNAWSYLLWILWTMLFAYAIHDSILHLEG